MQHIGPELAALRTSLADFESRMQVLLEAPALQTQPALAIELYSVERSLVGARRALARAAALV